MTTDSINRHRGMVRTTSIAPQLVQANEEILKLRNELNDAKRTIAQQDKHLEACAEQVENLLGSLIEAAQQRQLVEIKALERESELTKALDLMNERQHQEWARAENTEAMVEALRNELIERLDIEIFIFEANGWSCDEDKARLAQLRAGLSAVVKGGE